MNSDTPGGSGRRCANVRAADQYSSGRTRRRNSRVSAGPRCARAPRRGILAAHGEAPRAGDVARTTSRTGGRDRRGERRMVGARLNSFSKRSSCGLHSARTCSASATRRARRGSRTKPRPHRPATGGAQRRAEREVDVHAEPSPHSRARSTRSGGMSPVTSTVVSSRCRAMGGARMPSLTPRVIP